MSQVLNKLLVFNVFYVRYRTPHAPSQPSGATASLNFTQSYSLHYPRSHYMYMYVTIYWGLFAKDADADGDERRFLASGAYAK